MGLESMFKKKEKKQKKPDVPPYQFLGKEYEQLPAPEDGKEWVKCWTQRTLSPYDALCLKFKESDFTSCAPAVLYLQHMLTRAREDERTLEPMHVQFVGIPRQGKTQFAMRIMMLLDQMGFNVVERTSEDGYFDDLNKHRVNMSRERDPDDSAKFKYHPSITDPAERMRACQIDVVLLDEFNSKTKDSTDLSTLLNGVTCMPWRPLVADPRGKGETYKPVLWLTTANHEITEHDYNVTALLKRVHMRVIVENGKVYTQDCFEIIPPEGRFLGGFKTCQGVFGKTRKERTSTTITVHGEGPSRTESRTITNTGTFFEEVVDTRSLSSFVCRHCKEMTFPALITSMLYETASKLERGVQARDNFLDKMASDMSSTSSVNESL